MLIWVASLHCEAKPLIDYYRLKKIHAANPFDLYRNDDQLCVVSGIGKLACASACAWVAGRFAREAGHSWINLGTAGAAEHKIGELYSLDQIVDGASGQRYYPAPGAASELAGATCITIDQPSTDYDAVNLFDMEASGFMHSVTRFSSAELVQSLKLISDNRQRQTGRKAQAISDLVHARLDAITRQAESLMELEREHSALFVQGDSWNELIELARFSQTQQNRLRVLWRYLLLRDFDAASLLRDLRGRKSATAILQALEQISRRDGAGL